MYKRAQLIVLLLGMVLLTIWVAAIGLLSLKKEAKTNTNSPKNLIKVTKPQKDEYIASPLRIEGEARGQWYFEATFPIQLIDSESRLLGEGYAQSQGEWMTENFVPFLAELKFSTSTTDTGMLILQKSNPSGLPENDDEIRIPIRFQSNQECKVTGCNDEICADEYTAVRSACIYKPEFECYKTAKCERQKNGSCDWTQTDELIQCIAQAQTQDSVPEAVP